VIEVSLLLALWFVLAQSDGPGKPGQVGPQDGAQESGQEEAEDIPLSLRVNRAIALGVDFLKSRQGPEGDFGLHSNRHPGGMTALAAFTFLRSGVRRDDPALRKALAAVDRVTFESTYSAAVHLLLCEARNDPSCRESAEASLDFLLEHQERGVWAYPWDHLCNSNTQFALLGLRAARHMGLEVSEGVLLEALDGLSLFEGKDGGFGYEPDDRDSYAGMTAATLASFAVLQEAGADHARLKNALERERKTIEEAERWMERNFDAARNRYDDGRWRVAAHFAYLWAVERWCGLTGRDRIAGHDWYSEGAAWLVEEQNRNGSWGADRQEEYTCFALLFLRRATMSPSEELSEIYDEIDRLRAARPWRRRQAGPTSLRLTDWLVAGPWDEKSGKSLLLEPPFDPAKLEPRERAKVARQEWRRVALDAQRWTDLDKLFDDKGNHRLWLLATTLEVSEGSPEDPVAARLWFEFEDGWDVWLDGQRVSRERRRAQVVTGDVMVPLRLAPGPHALVVLLEDDDGPAAFGAVLTANGFGPPPEGIVARAGEAEPKPKKAAGKGTPR